MVRQSVAVVFAAFAFFVSTFLAVAADWPQFRGLNRDGVSTETGLLDKWPEKGPPLLWEKEVGTGFAGPVIAGSRVVFFHRLDKDEVVECFEAATGKPVWAFKYPTRYRDDFGFDNGPRCAPLIADGKVFTLGAEGRLHCLKLEDGTKVWERSLTDDYKPAKGFFGVGTSPLLEGSRLLVNVGAKGAGIVAFDKDTGKEAWKATSQAASYSSPVAATIGGVRHAIFLTREGIVSVDPDKGDVRFTKAWRSRNNLSVNAATPVVVGDRLFVSACYDTGALLAKVRKDGLDDIWNNDESMSCHYDTCVHRDGFLYGMEGREEQGARLRCIELETGKVRWTSEKFGCGSIVLVEGKLVILNKAGELVLVEATPTAYRELSRVSVLGSPCRAQLALADGRLLARDPKSLKCWNLKK